MDYVLNFLLFEVNEYQQKPATDIVTVAKLHQESNLRVRVAYENLNGERKQKTVLLPIANYQNSEDPIFDSGLELLEQDGKLIVDLVTYGSTAAIAGFDFDQEVLSVSQLNNRPNPYYCYVLAALLLIGVIGMQRKRKSL